MRRAGAALLLLVLAPVGCGDNSSPDAALAAEDVRELQLFDSVPVRSLSREEYAAEAADNASQISDDYLQYYADTYGRLGFFDPSLDLRPVFAGSSSDWVGASYSPTDKRITLVGDAAPDVIVHEWVHALQDQHFDLVTYDDFDSSDSFLARRAVVEGDATLAQIRYVAEYGHGVNLDGIDWAALFDLRRQYSDDTLANAAYPVVFLDYVSFVYSYGLEYVTANLTGARYDAPTPGPAPYDWTLEDNLFETPPPPFTQDVLDLGATDAVEPIGLEAVPAALAGRFETVDWDSLGEWYSYLLFYPLDTASGGSFDARALALAWDGDRALFLTETDSGAPATVWTSVWDDEATATTVADLLWTLYGRTPIAGQPDTIATGDDGETVWIEQRGRALVAARNLPVDADAAALIDAAFAGPTAVMPRRRPSLPEALERLRKKQPSVSANNIFPL